MKSKREENRKEEKTEKCKIKSEIEKGKSMEKNKKSRFLKDNKGMGTVEMILIIVVLIGLVLIFKTRIQELTSGIFDKIAVDSAAILA